MGSFEWMELQTLTSDINASRSRLAAARANKDTRLVRILESEITEAEAKRDRLLAHITTNLTGPADAAQNPPEGAAQEKAADGDETPAEVETPAEEPVAEAGAAEAPEKEAPEEEAAAQEAQAEDAPGEPVEQPAEGEREAPAAAAQAGSVEGGMVVWDQLTPDDIQRALAAIGDRRTEMLARHAEELKSLEAEQAELEGLEKAIDAFVRRRNKTEEGGEATASAA